MLFFILLQLFHSLLLLTYERVIFLLVRLMELDLRFHLLALIVLLRCSDPLNQLTSFMPVSLQKLNDITAHMKPTRSPGDELLSSLFSYLIKLAQVFCIVYHLVLFWLVLSI